MVYVEELRLSEVMDNTTVHEMLRNGIIHAQNKQCIEALKLLFTLMQAKPRIGIVTYTSDAITALFQKIARIQLDYEAHLRAKNAQPATPAMLPYKEILINLSDDEWAAFEERIGIIQCNDKADKVTALAVAFEEILTKKEV